MYGVVYKIVNKKNNRIYIGQTIRTLKERFKEHKKLRNKSNAPIHVAIKEYGVENFYIEMLEECDSQEMLNEKEKYWISYYRNLDNNILYNIQKGGIRSSKIKCKNIITGEILYFNTVNEAVCYFGMNSHDIITTRCSGNNKYVYDGKFIFAYKDEEFKEFFMEKQIKRRKRIRVTKDNITHEFTSYVNMEKFYNLKRNSIGAKVYKFRKKYGNKFVFREFEIEELN